MLLLLSLIAADAPIDIATLKPLDQRVKVAVPAPPKRSPYRLDPNVAGPADGKEAALAITGADCNRIGTALCTSTPRVIYATEY